MSPRQHDLAADLFAYLTIAFIFAIILCLVTQAHCSTVDTKFLVSQGASFGSALADAHSTNVCLSRGATELNPFLGSRPSPAHVYGFALGTAVAGAVLSYELKKHGHKTWIIEPAANTAGHVTGAAINSRCL